MIGRFLHPSLRRLARFLDGELEARARASVQAHLTRCNRCRTRVRELRDVTRALQKMPVAEPPEALRDQITTAVRNGVAAILPLSPSGSAGDPVSPRRPGPHPIGVGAALLLMAAGGALALVHTRSLEAHFPALRIAPEGPLPGSTVTLRFSGDSYVADGGRLTARAELFDADGRSSVITVPLERSLFIRGSRGELPLPPNVVYALLAVEDSSGERVESNGGRLWDVVAHDSEGRPNFDGLRERAERHYGTRPDLALEAAKAMVAHHPDRARSWSTLYAVEQRLVRPARPEELVRRHRPHLERLEQRFDTVRPTAEDLAAMTLYARGVGDDDAQERWTTRLLEEAPQERLAIQLRLQALEGEYGAVPARLLEEHERLWSQVGPARDLGRSGFAVAERVGDAAATIQWADRWASAEPEERVVVAERLVGHPETRPEGLRRLRAELRVLDAPAGLDARAPGETRGEQRAAKERTRGRLLAALGEALMEEGRTEQGADTLLLATDAVWDPGLFRRAAGALLAQGDTLTAVPLLARIAVDPETQADERGEMARLALGRLTYGVWEAALQDAETEMRSRLLAEARSRRLPPKLPMEDLQGTPQDLRALLAGEVAVVSLWYCVCEQFGPLIERHRSLAAELADEEIPVFTVLATPPAPDGWGATVDLDLATPVLLDPQGTALRAFGSARTPAYFVVDEEGAVRFFYTSEEQIRRLVRVLRHEGGPPGAGAPATGTEH